MKKEIEPFLVPDQAYVWLQNSSVGITKYPETTSIIAAYCDHEAQTTIVPPKEIARELMEADKTELMCDDIFWFIEKVLRDTYYQIKDPYASYELGCLYYFDRFNHVDYAKAFKYFSKEDQFNESNTMVGVCYFYGQGIEQNYEKAYHQLVKAALTDASAWALYLLGDMYKNGYYVNQDVLEAHDLYHHAFEISNKLKFTKYTQAEILMRMGQDFFERPKDQEDIQKALEIFNYAERLYIDSIKEGNPNIKEKIKDVRDKQSRVKLLLDQILFENKDTYVN
jgi:uncharacterized protein